MCGIGSRPLHKAGLITSSKGGADTDLRQFGVGAGVDFKGAAWDSEGGSARMSPRLQLERATLLKKFSR